MLVILMVTSSYPASSELRAATKEAGTREGWGQLSEHEGTLLRPLLAPEAPFGQVGEGRKEGRSPSPGISDEPQVPLGAGLPRSLCEVLPQAWTSSLVGSAPEAS